METIIATKDVIQTSPELVTLAAIFIILVGAGLMPALVVIVRFVFRFAVNEAISTASSELIKWIAIAAGALVFGLLGTPAPAAESGRPVAAVVSEAAPTPGGALATAITQTFARVVAAGAKPLPVWLLDAAARIYTAYRVHQVGKKADEAARIALAAMTELAHVRAEIDSGRMDSEQEQRAPRARFEAQATQIEGLEKRVKANEDRTKRLEHKADRLLSVATRPGCPKLHAWDRKLRRCTNRQ